MYIHPFLCGVLVTLAVETVVLFIAAALVKEDKKQDSE